MIPGNQARGPRRNASEMFRREYPRAPGTSSTGHDGARLLQRIVRRRRSIGVCVPTSLVLLPVDLEGIIPVRADEQFEACARSYALVSPSAVLKATGCIERLR